MGLDISVYKGEKNLTSLCEIEGEEGEIQAVHFLGDRVAEKSKLHPDHMFTLGYFRSSYNSGGYNNVVTQLTGWNMYTAFDERVLEDDSGQFGGNLFVPDWKEARRGLKMIRKALLKSDLFVADTITVDDPEVDSEEEAVDLFRKEIKRKRHEEGNNGYSNMQGIFYPKDPLKVYGLIKGLDTPLGSSGDPCVYFITKLNDADWYIEATDVMIETCDMAIKDKNHTYFMNWWG